MDKSIFVKTIDSSLEKMYEHGLEKTTVTRLNEKIVEGLDVRYRGHSSGQRII